MSDVQVIKANRSENRIRGRKVEVLRVAAYCRVSTDSEDQLNSYKSQVTYYTDLIKKKHEWTKKKVVMFLNSSTSLAISIMMLKLF